jgi:hypothetical protein
MWDSRLRKDDGLLQNVRRPGNVPQRRLPRPRLSLPHDDAGSRPESNVSLQIGGSLEATCRG